jgi:hypothetical protein
MSTNYINQIIDSTETTHDIAEGVTTRVFRGTCSTGSSTKAKVVTLDDATNFSLTDGVRVLVTFSYGNSTANITLNVNNTGALDVYVPNTATTLSVGNPKAYWGCKETVLFTYANGMCWIMGPTAYGQYQALSLTDTKVNEAYSTANDNYPMLLCATAGITSTSSRGATTSILNNQIYANPSTGTITATRFNGGASESDGSTEKVVNIKYGSAAPTGSATTGTVYFQTGSSAYTFVDRTDVSGKSCTTSGTQLASFTLLPGLYLITYQFNCGTISSGTVRCDLKLGSVVKNQVRGASGHILSGSAIVQCIDSSSTITFTGYTTSGTSSSSEIHYSYVKLF